MKKHEFRMTGFLFPLAMLLAALLGKADAAYRLTACYVCASVGSLGAQLAMRRSAGILINKGKAIFSCLMGMALSAFGAGLTMLAFYLLNVDFGVYTVAAGGAAAAAGAARELFTASDDTTSALMSDFLMSALLCAVLLFFGDCGLYGLLASLGVLALDLIMIPMTYTGEKPVPSASLFRELPAAFPRAALFPALAAGMLYTLGTPLPLVCGLMAGLAANELTRVPFSRDPGDAVFLPVTAALCFIGSFGALAEGGLVFVCAALAGVGAGCLFYAPRNIRGYVSGVIPLAAAAVGLYALKSPLVPIISGALMLAIAVPDVLMSLRRRRAVRIREEALKTARTQLTKTETPAVSQTEEPQEESHAPAARKTRAVW